LVAAFSPDALLEDAPDGPEHSSIPAPTRAARCVASRLHGLIPPELGRARCRAFQALHGMPDSLASACPDRKERSMNEDAFNMSVRRFLKQVGITAQREMEAAIRQAIAQGNLTGNEKLQATATITVSRTSLKVVVKDEIRLE